MALIRSLAILILGTACVPAHTPIASFDSSRNQRIVGGVEIKASDPIASYVVMLRTIKDNQLEICTGTFISDSAILTAAHCVSEDPQKMAIIYALQPFVQDKVIELPIAKIARHEKYKESFILPNDIAIVFFDGGLPPGARIADFRDTVIDGFPLHVLGYGRTEGKEDSSQGLREEGILRGVFLQPELLRIKDETIEARQDSGHGACFGDSGGPALVETNAKTYVAGIVSGGGNETRSNIDQCLLPSVFMRVSFFRLWIERVLEANRTPGRTSRAAASTLVSSAR